MCLLCWDEEKKINIEHGGPRTNMPPATKRSPIMKSVSKPPLEVRSWSLKPTRMSNKHARYWQFLKALAMRPWLPPKTSMPCRSQHPAPRRGRSSATKFIKILYASICCFLLFSHVFSHPFSKFASHVLSFPLIYYDILMYTQILWYTNSI